ncbi:MAG: VWA domain-containing protein [Isosphaeraceae bacterium]|nr:VWA domain-containing protein [Isosphaeraceae bacterium]
MDDLMRLSLELTRPFALVALIALPILAIVFRRGLVDLPRRQLWISLILRSLIVVLLVLSLAGLTLLEPTTDRFVVFAVDRSASVGSDAPPSIDDYLTRATAEARAGRYAFVEFGGKPGPIRAELPKPMPKDDAGATADRSATDPLDPRATNLAAAIETAAAAIPPFFVPRIVLLSDGNETVGNGLEAALRAGVEVSTVPLPVRSGPEIQLAGVEVPAQVRQGEPFNVEVVVASDHDDDDVEIEVFKGAIRVVSERRPIRRGENRFVFRQEIAADRLATYTARVRGGKDTLLDNNSDIGLVFTSGKPRVLMIESSPRDADEFVSALREHEIEVDVRPTQGMPESLSDLQNYEMLILSNVPATALTTRQMDLARTYVRDLGGGFLMLGGDQSFGLGGYYKTALEEILPVRSDFEKEKEKPSLAMVLVIDKSGSMGGEKIELAKEAAKSAIELLGPNDKVGVIAFEGAAYWVSEIHPCSDKAAVLERVASIEAGGGTSMYPAMEEAYEALRAATAKLKHVIILTDGQSAPGDFEGITRSMSSARITVSTVGVGEGADVALLEEISRLGNGRHYFTDDPSAIPQIFAKETMSASKSAINEQPFTPRVVRATQALRDLDVENSPLLLGYVITRPKPTSEFILASESGDPLLSWWRYGLGMSVAFTSDAKNRWAPEWITWPDFGKFWAQVIRHAMRKSDAKGIVVEVDQRDRRALVRLDAVDAAGRYISEATTDVTVIHDRLPKRTLSMKRTAPGRFEAEIETPEPGAYHLELTLSADGRPLYRQSRGLAVGYPDELRIRPVDRGRLAAVARASGGVLEPPPESVFTPDERTVSRARPLHFPLLAAAILLFVVDVALRRIDFSLVGRRFRRIPPAGFANAS